MQLRDKAPEVAASVELPPKRAYGNFDTKFIEKRKAGLVQYLKYLTSEERLKNPIVEELVGGFLSDGSYEKGFGGIARKMDTLVNPIVSTIKTVSSKIKTMSDEVETLLTRPFHGNESDGDKHEANYNDDSNTYDVESYLVQEVNLEDGGDTIISSSKSSKQDKNSTSSSGGNNSSGTSKSSNDKKKRTGSFEEWNVISVVDSDDDNISFRIVLALLDEVFELKHRNKWLRRRVMALLKQIITQTFGDTINRYTL